MYQSQWSEWHPLPDVLYCEQLIQSNAFSIDEASHLGRFNVQINTSRSLPPLLPSFLTCLIYGRNS